MENIKKTFSPENDKKSKLIDQINEIKADIAEIESLELETRYPHLLDLKYDSGLPGEEYRAWQQLKALRVCRQELEGLKKELKDII